nr:ankyrin repeat-containing protein [Tanacetum cinerariifolium]
YFLDSSNFEIRIVVVDDTPIVSDKLDQGDICVSKGRNGCEKEFEFCEPEANLEQFKIEQAAINSEAAKQRALLQATIDKNKVAADRQFAEILNALKALQPPTTLPEDITTMIDTEKSGEDCGNLDEFMVASDVEEAVITTPIMVVAKELGQKLIYDFGEADLMLGSDGKSI